MTPCIVALGSNLGDREANLEVAVAKLGSVFDVIARSRWMDTTPMYLVDQPRFLNGVVKIHSAFGPLATLNELQLIETEMGRERLIENGPRTMDLDLITYGILQYRFNLPQGHIVIPHERAFERDFVLGPWSQIDKESLDFFEKILTK